MATKEWMSNAGYEIYTKYVQPLEDEIARLKRLLGEIENEGVGLVLGELKADGYHATACGQCVHCQAIAARAKEPPNDQ